MDSQEAALMLKKAIRYMLLRNLVSKADIEKHGEELMEQIWYELNHNGGRVVEDDS